IMFLTGSTVGVEWAEYFYHFHSGYPSVGGYVRTCLCALLVLLIGETHLTRRDHGLLFAAFVLTLIADYFLVLRRDHIILGTVFFLGVHGLYIARHAHGLMDSLEPASRARTIQLMVVTGVIAYGGAAILLLLIANILLKSGVFGLYTGYLACLATSLWMAWGTVI